MHRVIVVGSPRPDGRSASLADELFNACIEECPEDGVSIVSVASLEVSPCRGCDACREATAAPEKLPESDDNLAIMPIVAQSDAVLHRCVIHDDMTDVRKHIDAADELIVVTPVYFASVPAQLKCLMDRMQPYYWSDVRKLGRRPMVLHVVGEGGDPHGFEPLIGTVRSSFGAVGFDLELVLDWVGKIDESGEIVAEAEEYPLPPVGGFAGFTIDGDEFEIVEVDGEFPEGFSFDFSEDWEDGEDLFFDEFEEGEDEGDFGPEPVEEKRSPKSAGERAKLTISQDAPKKAGDSGRGSKKAAGKGSGKGGSGKGKASYGKNKQTKSANKGGKRRG